MPRHGRLSAAVVASIYVPIPRGTSHVCSDQTDETQANLRSAPSTSTSRPSMEVFYVRVSGKLFDSTISPANQGAYRSVCWFHCI